MVLAEKKIFLIRHGETMWTLTGQHTGLTDIPLTERGFLQAVRLKKFLQNIHFEKVFSSPLTRARATCEISGLLDKAEIDQDLLEWNYGSYEGLTTAEIRKTNPQWSIFSSGAPNGESIQEVGDRADRVLVKIKQLYGNIAIFSSGHFLRVLAARWIGESSSFGKHLALFPASISILGYEREQPVLIEWNNSTHSSLST